MDDPIRGLVDCLDHRLLRVSRGRRIDPPAACAGCDFVDHSLRGRRTDRLSSGIENARSPRES